MKVKKWIPLLILALVFLLELLPYGAVCNFLNPEGPSFRETFSYFDPVPFGYANFGPLITAILTCIMLGLSLLYLCKPGRKVLSLWKTLSLVAVVASLAPLMFGLHFYSVVGGAISLLLIAEAFAVRKM